MSPATEKGQPVSALLAVDGLTIDFLAHGTASRAVDGVGFSMQSGEVLALVGESGSGKSVTAMSILGLLPETARVTGSIKVDGAEMLSLTPRQRRSASARKLAVVFQDPVAALNPVYTVGFQLAEAVRVHHPELSRAEAKARGKDLLALVGIPDPEKRLDYYPHQFSGGQCQRVMIAMAISGDPDLLIADEPTTALDVTIQAEVLDLLRDLSSRLSTAVLLITHDMGVVADFADRVIVMRTGKVVERATVDELFYNPQESYTKELLAAVPRITARADAPAPESLRGAELAAHERVLQLEDIVVEFGSRVRGTQFRAVDSVSLEMGAGDLVGLVGESGSGKSTLGRVAIGAIRPVSGRVQACGIDPAHSSRAERMTLSRKSAMVFQNPTSSLDPRYTIGASIAESLIVHQGLRGKALSSRVAELLDSVGLPPGWVGRYPYELSGGQRQRASIARAISLNPDLLIADEPTSALDVSVQARVLDLFADLQRQLGFACLFISHDLAVVDQVCNRVVVLNKGKIVESGSVAEILGSPRESYTQRLIAASPVPDPAVQRARRA